MKTLSLLILLISVHFLRLNAGDTTGFPEDSSESQTEKYFQLTKDRFESLYANRKPELVVMKRTESVINLVIGTLAMVSNLTILKVTSRYPSIGIPQVYMAALAICDLCIGVLTSWRCIAGLLYFLSGSGEVSSFLAYTYWPVAGLDVAASISASLIAMALSVDRCLALKFPMKHSELWSTPKAKILVSVVGLLSFVVGLNYPLRLKISRGNPLNSTTEVPTVFTNLGGNVNFSKACKYLEFLLRFAIPFMVMAVSNTWTLLAINRSDQFRRELDGETRSNVKTVKCLTITIGLVIIFFLTQLPKAAFLLDGMVFFFDHRGILAFEIFVVASNLMTKTNSVVNVFVYLALSREFRGTFVSILRVCKRREAAIDVSN